MDDHSKRGMTDGVRRAEGPDERSAVLWLWDSKDLREVLLFHADLIKFDESANAGGVRPDLRRVIAVAGQPLLGGRDLLLSTTPDPLPQAPDGTNIGLVIANTERVRREVEEGCRDLPCIKLDVYEQVQGAVPQASERVPSAAITYAYIAEDCLSGLDSVLKAFGVAFGGDGGAELLVYAREPDSVQTLIEKYNQTNNLGPVRVEIGSAIGALSEPCNWLFDVLIVESAPNRLQPAAYEAAIGGRQVIAVPLRRRPDDSTAGLANGAEVDPENHDHPSGELAAEMLFAARRMAGSSQSASPCARFARALAPAKLARRLQWITQGPLRMIASSGLTGVGWVTRWNVMCGIGDHAAHQIASYIDRHVIMAPRETPLLADDGSNVFRCWNRGLADNGLEEAAQVAYRERLATIVIHFNWAFYHPADLHRFIVDLRSSGRVVILDAHSTSPEGAAHGQRLPHFADCFNACDWVLVHQPADLIRLRSVAPNARVSVEPLGITDYEPDRGPDGRSAKFDIACFGFCLPNKGIEELVFATSMLLQSQEKVRLLLLNAEHPAPQSRQTIEKIRELISQLGLSGAVTFVTDYLDEAKCMDLLSKASLVVNPYQRTGESASAAARFALASTTPVLVTPLPIFDDLGDAVFRAKGTSPVDLANAIRTTLAELKADSGAAAGVRKAAAKWRKVHDLGAQSERIFGVAKNIGRSRRAEDWLRIGAC